MLQKMKQHQVYNDGVLDYGKITAQYDSAKKKIGEGFIKSGSLMFGLMKKRDEDLVLANSLGYSLDLKIKTPKINFDSSYKVRIDSIVYDVYKVDFDEVNNYLYCKVIK